MRRLQEEENNVVVMCALDYDKVDQRYRSDYGQYLKRTDDVLDKIFRLRFGDIFLSIADLRVRHKDGAKSKK